MPSELIQLELDIETSVADFTPTEAKKRNSHLHKWESYNWIKAPRLS